MHLGIDSQAGFVYEGLGNPELPVVPSPNITQAKLIESEADWKRQFRHPEIGLVSLENNLALYAWHGEHHIGHITGLRARRGW